MFQGYNSLLESAEHKERSEPLMQASQAAAPGTCLPGQQAQQQQQWRLEQQQQNRARHAAQLAAA
jgi:hypothetical protein